MALRLNTMSTDGAVRHARDMGQSVLPVLGALVLGLIISGAVAVTAAEAGILFVIPVILGIPVGLVLFRYPLTAVMLWLLIFPFVVRGSSGLAVPVYYAIHRLMIPGTLWLVLLGSWVGAHKRPAVRFGLAEFVMLVSLLWALGSIFILGQQPLPLTVELYDRLFIPYCMYWLIRLIAPTAADLRRLLPAALVTLFMQAAIGIVSWFAPNSLPPQWLGEAGERVVGTFRNPAVFTSTVVFLFLLIFQYGINSQARRLRFFGIAVLALGIFCVFISFSRGSWLGGILVVIGLTLAYPHVMLRLEAVGLTLFVILGSTVLSREIDFAYQRLNDQETANSRLLTGAKSLSMIEQRPLFGWGYGNYDVYDDQFRVMTIDPGSVKESDHTSHNTYLTVMAEQGIPALVFYLFPTLWWLLASLVAARRMPRRGFWSVTLLILLWLLIVDHVTVSSFMDMIRFNLFGTTIYWMALGLIAAVVTPYLQTARTEMPKSVSSTLTVHRNEVVL